MRKKKTITLIAFVLSLISLLTGCDIIEVFTNQEESCNCCIDGLLESEPLQGLIDGDTFWMGLEVGKTKPEDVLPHFSGMNISYCISYLSEEVCDSDPEDMLSKPWGVINLTLLDFNCEEFWISWKGDTITSIGFRCEDCITIESILDEIGFTPYISSIIVGLHETEITTVFIFPDLGLIIGTESTDRYEAEIHTNTTITFIDLYPPESDLQISSVNNFITQYDVDCARPWTGYGDLYELYYPEDTGKGCPYLIN